MCNNRVHLNVDQSNAIKLSNWSCHVKLCNQGKKIKSKQKNKVSLNDYFSTCNSSVSVLEKTSGSQTPESPISDLLVPTTGLRPGLQLEASVSQPSMSDLQSPPSDLQLPTSGLQPDFQPATSGSQSSFPDLQPPTEISTPAVSSIT